MKLIKADLHTKDGPVLYVAGADLVSGTPIYDIKPYLPYADSHPDGHADSGAHGNPNRRTDGHAHSGTNGDTYGSSHSRTDCRPDRNPKPDEPPKNGR